MSAPVNVMPGGGGCDAGRGSISSVIRADGSQFVTFFDRHGCIEAEIVCANNRVASCVKQIEDWNIPDAIWAAEVLNRYGHLVPSPGPVS